MTHPVYQQMPWSTSPALNEPGQPSSGMLPVAVLNKAGRAADAMHEVKLCLPAAGNPSATLINQVPSDLQIAKVGNAGFHHVKIHFDEVILYAAGFRGGKNFLPIQSVLSHGHNFLRFR